MYKMYNEIKSGVCFYDYPSLDFFKKLKKSFYSLTFSYMYTFILSFPTPQHANMLPMFPSHLHAFSFYLNPLSLVSATY